MKKLLLLSLLLPIPAFASPFSCGTSAPYCKNMSSCAEAQFYLNQCNAHRLDRDGDGVPCENVCGKSAKGKKGKKAKSVSKKKGAVVD